jgi:hypothetical protein
MNCEHGWKVAPQLVAEKRHRGRAGIHRRASHQPDLIQLARDPGTATTFPQPASRLDTLIRCPPKIGEQLVDPHCRMQTGTHRTPTMHGDYRHCNRLNSGLGACVIAKDCLLSGEHAAYARTIALARLNYPLELPRPACVRSLRSKTTEIESERSGRICSSHFAILVA